MNVDEPKKSADKTAAKESIFRSLFPRRPLQWVGVAMALGAVAAVGGALVTASGLANVSAVAPHPEGWAHLLKFASTRSFAEHAGHPEPAHEPLDSPAMIMSGASNYAVVCADCHGAPGYGQSPIALSMRPEPPMIVNISKEYSDAELFWVVTNGVRYAGMPAWPVSNRPDEVWAMVAFLKAMPGMNRDTYLRLTGANERQKVAALGSPTSGNLAGAPGTSDTIGITTLTSGEVTPERNRPYLPGDPQDPGTSPAAVISPRTGFLNIGAGGDPTAACATCHGAEGSGRDGGAFPNLTLQSPQYLYDSLKAFASGQRQSGVMWPIAASLSDDQMRNVATRFGAAPPIGAKDKPAAGSAPVGEDIAHAGVATPDDPKDSNKDGTLPKGAIERCTSCHMPGAYLGKVIPRLNGQNAAYTRMQLFVFRAGGRGDSGPYDPMVSASHNLTDAEIRAVANYYASLPPIAKTSKN